MKQGIVYKQWAPDSGELGADILTRAQNVVSKDEGYGPYLPLNNQYAVLTAGVLASNGGTGAFIADDVTWYVQARGADDAVMYESTAGSSFNARGTVGSGQVSFAQFDHLVIAAFTASVPFKHTIGAASNYSTLGSSTVPASACIGVVNRFVVIGNLVDGGVSRENVIRWSGLDDPTSWPTPNSATAIAQQAGEQELNLQYGDVRAIHGGDQYAIILQKNSVTRMTYVGPPVVFQFDKIDDTHGLYFKRGSIQVGKVVYFIAECGLCRTDGVTVERIGYGRVDRYLFDSTAIGPLYSVNLGYEPSTGLIYIAFNTQTIPANADRLLIYNPATDKFTLAVDNTAILLTPKASFGVEGNLVAFGASGTLGRMAATAGSAVIETADIELNPGGRTFVSGIKPDVESTGTAPTVGVRLGTRNTLDTAPSYTSTTSAFAGTGFANFRSDAKYVRAEVNITGDFEKTNGFVADFMPSSDR